MLNTQRLVWILGVLLTRGWLHAGQRQDVLNRGEDQARHIMLDKRAELRRLLGKRRVVYRVSEIEVIASFRFRFTDDKGEDQALSERLITQAVAVELGMRFVEIDPLELDYRLVTEAFGGPFAERHLIIALEDSPEQLTVAVADPWNRDVLEQVARFKQKRIKPVLAIKSAIIQVIAEFHGFRKSMKEAASQFASDLPDLGNLEQLYKLKGGHRDRRGRQAGRPGGLVPAELRLRPARQRYPHRAQARGDLGRAAAHRRGPAPPSTCLPAGRPPGHGHLAGEDPRPDGHRGAPQAPRTGASRPPDGRDLEVELRVSTVPTAFGEKVVIRVFDPERGDAGHLGNLGFFDRDLLHLRVA